MKNIGLVAVGGIALLQLASAVRPAIAATSATPAGCCRARNVCLKAVAAVQNDGVADCSSRLITTVTPSTSIVTETLTSTQDAEATELFTEMVTETAYQTILATETTTVTASTQTNLDIESATVLVTYTATETAAAVTSTSTSTTYQGGLTVRDAAPSELPDYAATACSSAWAQYVSACQCAGVEPTTVTASTPLSTVTVPADAVFTTTVTTQTITEVETVSVVAVTSSTETSIVSLTETVTDTQTDVATDTATALATSTPTVVVPLVCKPTNYLFAPHAVHTDGTTRYLTNLPAWQTISGTNLSPYTWTLDSNGNLQLAHPIGTATSVLAAYVVVPTSTTASSLRVSLKAVADVEAGVASGTYAWVHACVNADTGVFTASALGRYNILNCGNFFYLSTGTGTDLSTSCVQYFPATSEGS